MTIDLHLVLSLCGYLGAVLLLGSFAASSRGRLSTRSRRYHTANLVGGCALLVSCIAQAAWPSVGVNLVWMVISLLTLAQAAHSRSDSRSRSDVAYGAPHTLPMTVEHISATTYR